MLYLGKKQNIRNKHLKSFKRKQNKNINTHLLLYVSDLMMGEKGGVAIGRRSFATYSNNKLRNSSKIGNHDNNN